MTLNSNRLSCRNTVLPTAVLCAAALLVPRAAATEVKQRKLPKEPAMTISDPAKVAEITAIVQGGNAKKIRYTPAMLETGLHFRTGAEATLSAKISPVGFIGVHGDGTVIRYIGTWDGDEGWGYPMMVLTEGGKMVWEADAQVDFVMDGNFYTRQLWLWGDGTGTLELAPGFISDRTQNATVANAMGTIRLAGATLITHHSQSLPYNSRPDGRGGLYHNGHVVFEGDTPSTWSIQSNQQLYTAQIDFASSGTINTQAPFTHTGHLQACLDVGNSGNFVSTGAFRTTQPDVTITKTGQSMLSLEGHQGYYPNSKLVVAEGLLRVHTDPAGSEMMVSFKDDHQYGNHLHLEVMPSAKVVLSSPLIRLASLTVHEGATVWQIPGCTVEVSGERTVADGTWIESKGAQ